ncbi:MAG: hypothetical protein O2921_07590 [Chloroflexi bacterium]|nr:hypothetical protein [Chloroflexota bacterium]
MAKCNICGDSAGWFKKTHAECVQIVTDLTSKTQEMVADAVPQISRHKEIEYEVESVVAKSGVLLEPYFERQALAAGWKLVSSRALANDGITEDLELALLKFVKLHNLWEHELKDDLDYSDFIFWGILRDLAHDKIPNLNIHTSSPIPLNLHKDEMLIWLIDQVVYSRKIVRRSLVGGSTGGAIELGSGVYYGKSEFELHETSISETESVATGFVAITTRHLYFSGEGTYFRVRYADIVATQSYKDGIGFQREGNDGMEYFLTEDVWRLWNLIENLKSEPNLTEYSSGS